ncbi:histidine kinase [Xanthomonas oryzae pv. oryzae]|nr:histidine kinase [Xanthomonas oryzae pv. oryzae]
MLWDNVDSTGVSVIAKRGDRPARIAIDGAPVRTSACRRYPTNVANTQTLPQVAFNTDVIRRYPNRSVSARAQGSELVQQAGTTMTDVLSSVKRVTAIMPRSPLPAPNRAPASNRSAPR